MLPQSPESDVRLQSSDATAVIRGPAITPIPYEYPNALPNIPGYDIERLVDHGGMSNIYLARQKGLNRPVAIKMIRPQDFLDDNIRKRFVLEASSIASLQHPNVVQIYEIGEFEGRPFLCLEYISGGNLERKISDDRPSPRQSAEIVRQLAEAIQAAHDKHIIHRDLKPANILWVDQADELELASSLDSGLLLPEKKLAVKITDFGLAPHSLRTKRSDEIGLRDRHAEFHVAGTGIRKTGEDRQAD